MKSFFTLVLLFPVLLFGQDIAIAHGPSADLFDINDLLCINQSNERLPDTATKSEMSTLPSMMGCSGMIIEFDSGAGLIGPENCGGIANGFILLAYSEGLYNQTSVGPGTPISASPPTMHGFSLTRNTDEYSAQFRSLLITGETIPYIELSVYPNAGSANPRQFNRYENCIISSISSGGSSGEDITTENIAFTFTKACYLSNELDFNTGGTILSSTDACVDLSLIDQSTCSCD
jgi:type VI protein secretion system component Hcp